MKGGKIVLGPVHTGRISHSFFWWNLVLPIVLFRQQKERTWQSNIKGFTHTICTLRYAWTITGWLRPGVPLICPPSSGVSACFTKGAVLLHCSTFHWMETAWALTTWWDLQKENWRSNWQKKPSTKSPRPEICSRVSWKKTKVRTIYVSTIMQKNLK